MGTAYAYSRTQFVELADIAEYARCGLSAAPLSSIALEAVQRVDALLEIERTINGHGADERLAVRQE